jgi:hypothetical protein
MVWNIFPTKFRISQTIQSSHPDTSCSLCSFPFDSTLHLFFSCPIARVVWRQSFWPLDSLALPVSNMTDWLLIILNPATIGIPHTASHMFQIFAAVACDQLWFSRNKAHHDKVLPNALTISATINRLVLEHHSAWSSSMIRSPEIWQKPCLPYYKVNYDTAIRSSFSAQAAIVRNFSGSVIGCSSIINPPCSALYGEARAALLAAQLAISLNIT